MDDLFKKFHLPYPDDEKTNQLMINAEKLTKGTFNITVPLRDYYLDAQLKEIGIENNEENRASFYDLIYSSPNLGNYTTGALLTDELIRRPDRKF